MTTTNVPFAVVTDASSGIGYALAQCCAKGGFDLIIAADQPSIQAAAQKLRQFGRRVEALEVDLATLDGVTRLYDAIGGRPVDALPSRRTGGAFHSVC
jgi:short-subunit dehydrogenase